MGLRRCGCTALAVILFVGVVVYAAQETNWRQSPPKGIAVGDIVFRKGNGIWTPYFINSSTREKRFSHVGIVSSVQSGNVSILHAEASELSGKGAVKEESWSLFFAKALEGAVYRYDGGQETAKRFAEEGRLKLGVPFDSAFDLSTTNKLYCTEFVRGAINAAVGWELVGCSSMAYRPFVALDDIYASHFTNVWDSSGCDFGN